MPDGLKSQYISYPFMQVANRPDWFRYVKDARIVVEIPAGNWDKSTNGDDIQVILKGMTGSVATVEVTCVPVGGKTVSVPIYKEKDVPAKQSFFIIDNSFDTTQGFAANDRLHPDCLTLLQSAPTINEIEPGLLKFYNGNNMTASRTATGVMLYGVEDGGRGLYKQEIAETEEYMEGKGLKSINGFSGDVWIKGAYPVRTAVTGGTVTTFTVTNDEVTE